MKMMIKFKIFIKNTVKAKYILEALRVTQSTFFFP